MVTEWSPSLPLSQDYEAEYEEDPNAIEGLPASVADLLDAPYDYGFNCDQQDAGYGYYADVNNGCKVFHICVPIYDNEGSLDRMDKYSFVCGEGTQFDQSTLTCNYPEVFPLKKKVTKASSPLLCFSLHSLARRARAYMGRSSLERYRTTTEPIGKSAVQSKP